MYVWTSPPTKSELSLILGISPRTMQRFLRGEYSPGRAYADIKPRRISSNDVDILERALTIIESYYESSLSVSRVPTGAIFWLLNSKSERWTNEHVVVSRIEDDNIPMDTPAEIAKRHAVVIDVTEPQKPDISDL